MPAAVSNTSIACDGRAGIRLRDGHGLRICVGHRRHRHGRAVIHQNNLVSLARLNRYRSQRVTEERSLSGRTEEAWYSDGDERLGGSSGQCGHGAKLLKTRVNSHEQAVRRPLQARL